MIDTKELRRLAQAATPGPWKLGQYLGSPRQFVIHMDVGDKGRGSDVAFTSAAFGNDETIANASFIAAANPAAITELLDRLEAAESDGLEQARLNGMGGEREAALLSKLEAAEKERDALRAKIERMEKQESVATVIKEGDSRYWMSERLWTFPDGKYPLYAQAGAQAQPAPSVPTESIGKMLAQVMEAAVANGANSVSMPDELVEVAAWLSGVQPNPANGQTRAVRDVIAERRRQIEAEGRTTQHDDANPAGVMSVAAVCYATGASNALVLAVGDTSTCPAPEVFPWEDAWWKPTTPRRDLVKAAALILAEIERLDRAAAQKTGGE